MYLLIEEYGMTFWTMCAVIAIGSLAIPTLELWKDTIGNKELNITGKSIVVGFVGFFLGIVWTIRGIAAAPFAAAAAIFFSLKWVGHDILQIFYKEKDWWVYNFLVEVKSELWPTPIKVKDPNEDV